MKRWILGILFCILLTVGASAAEVEALYINCTVQENGAVEYSLAVSCQFDTAEKTFVVPLAGEEISGVTVSGARWELDRSDGWTRAVLRSDGFLGRQTFVIGYRVPASGSDTLWLAGSRWEEDIREVSFYVELPAAPETEPTITSGYSGEIFDIVEMNGTGFSGLLPGGLMAHESLTAKLPDGFPAQPQIRRLLSLDWGLVVLLCIAALCVAFWAWKLRSRRLSIHSRVLPPEGWTPAEIPVILRGGRADMASMLPVWGQLGYLYVDFAGGELVIGQRMTMGSERPAYETELFRRMFEGRREFWMPDRRFRRAAAQASRSANRVWRSRLFSRQGGNPLLLRLGASVCAGMAVSASMLTKMPDGAGWTLLGILLFIPGAALGLLLQEGVGVLRRKPWFHWGLLPGAAALAALGLLCRARLLYLIPALALQIFAGWVLAFGGRRTDAGVQALGELLGLRRFLLQASPRRLKELLARDPSYMQTILPYAEQLGLASRIAQRLEKTRIEEPAWLQADKPLRTPSALAKREAELLTQLRRQPDEKIGKGYNREDAPWQRQF